VTAPFLAGKRAKIQAGQFDVEFPLQWLHKDLQLVTTTAYEQCTPAPTANVAKEMYALAVRAGLGEQDFSAIFRFLEQREPGA
jgi:3-hydroxyisobutyrate dehydrogenase/glyoxylate/succinic semialdehyde reductase